MNNWWERNDRSKVILAWWWLTSVMIWASNCSLNPLVYQLIHVYAWKGEEKISWDQKWLWREQVQGDMYMLQSQQMQLLSAKMYHDSCLYIAKDKTHKEETFGCRGYWSGKEIIRYIYIFLSIYCPLDVFILILFLLYKMVAAFRSFFFFLS